MPEYPGGCMCPFQDCRCGGKEYGPNEQLEVRVSDGRKRVERSYLFGIHVHNRMQVVATYDVEGALHFA